MIRMVIGARVQARKCPINWYDEAFSVKQYGLETAFPASPDAPLKSS
jgi:hypothetical protein